MILGPGWCPGPITSSSCPGSPSARSPSSTRSSTTTSGRPQRCLPSAKTDAVFQNLFPSVKFHELVRKFATNFYTFFTNNRCGRPENSQNLEWYGTMHWSYLELANAAAWAFACKKKIGVDTAKNEPRKGLKNRSISKAPGESCLATSRITRISKYVRWDDEQYLLNSRNRADLFFFPKNYWTLFEISASLDSLHWL